MTREQSGKPTISRLEARSAGGRARLPLKYDLDAIHQGLLPIEKRQRFEDVIHVANKGQPCREADADGFGLDVWEEEADDVDLGRACLVKVFIRVQVRLHRRHKGGVCEYHSRQ